MLGDEVWVEAGVAAGVMDGAQADPGAGFGAGGVQDFKQLKVWQKSHSLVLRVYSATFTFPEHERFGLTSQMRRAAFSVPSNIAEGCARGTRTELRQFLHIAAGSASELEYFFLLARDLRLLTEKQYEALYGTLHEIRRMLTGLIQRVGSPTLAASSTNTVGASIGQRHRRSSLSPSEPRTNN
jgi:four helix bundle protein